MRTGITITIESAKSDREHVSLDDFSFQLEALRKVLYSTESSLSGENAEIDWQIVDLTHPSPAEVVLRPVGTRITTDTDIISETVNKVVRCFKALSEDISLPVEMSQQMLGHYKTFSDRVRKGVLRVSIKSETDIVKINKTVIDAVVPSESESIGTVEGRLEFLNIHADRNVFRIYSAIPPEQVNCFFSPDKIKEAREAVGRKIRVLGKLTYPKGENFPRSIKVASIELLPEDDDLPSLGDLRGIAPDITGDLSSEEFVRNLRDAE
ncbi:MAG: hypothetical protein OXC97_04395 [Candidatus Dadabacteria bacterium]|nr:hypothetical protein [Candidatus Dadabacteria bacterium]